MANVGLECPLCLDYFKMPIVINCGHSYCTNCLKKHVGEATQFLCPLCRENIDVPNGSVNNFPRNYAIQPPATTETTTHKCSTHGNRDVDSFCRDCNVGLCSLCILKDHKHHNYIILEDSQDDHGARSNGCDGYTNSRRGGDGGAHGKFSDQGEKKEHNSYWWWPRKNGTEKYPWEKHWTEWVEEALQNNFKDDE